jgi:hypothetical protein
LHAPIYQRVSGFQGCRDEDPPCRYPCIHELFAEMKG